MQRAAAAAMACLTLGAPLAGQTLKGSSASVDRQHEVAIQHDFSFLDKPSDVRHFVDLGLLVKLSGGAHYELGSVSYPYARPAVKTFVERLSGQYEAACGEPLVVTSLTRPVDRQPRNASELSVHPAGMAVDLRVSRRRACRTWLENVLLSLEKTGVLEATRERRPSHYHVAVFPNQYVAYVNQLQKPTITADASDTDAAAAAGTSVAADAEATSTDAATTDAPAESPDASTVDYRVSRGDTLWDIARRVGSTVSEIKQLNGLRSSRLMVGQTLVLPAATNQN